MQIIHIARFAILITAVLATANPKPYQLGTITFNKALGLSRRQDQGYQPTQNFCSSGDTCEEACGAGYIVCDSTISEGSHCFNPTAGEQCCPNLSGHSCSDGYYCTEDTQKNTWCCPDEIDLVACAAAYSLTDALVSQTAAPSTTPASTTVTSSTAVIVVPTSTLSSTSTTTKPLESASVSSTTPSATSHDTVYVNPSGTLSVKTATTSQALFTGAANGKAVAYGGVPELLMVAGAVLFL